MEIRLLTEPAYAQEFDAAVDQIIDRYIAGEFKGDDLNRVRGYFLRSRERQEKLRFALALKEQKPERSAVITQKKKPRVPYLAIAASLVAIIGIGFFAWRALRPQPDVNDGLIALQAAFKEQRPIEGRLSDFNYAPLPNQRGASGKIDHVQREIAATLLLKSLRDNPTASSHHAAAKYYLMLRQFDEANKEFTAALALEPRNAKVQSDFGAALLEEGSAQSSAADNGRQLELYGRALEHIEKALEIDPSLQEALFNRALVFQFMQPSEQAKEAWNAYLQKDSTSAWSEEARRNIKIIEQEQRKRSAGPNDNATLFIAALRNSDDDAAWRVISSNYTSAGNEIVNRLLDSMLGVEPLGDALDAHETLAALEYVAKLEHDRANDRFTSNLVSNYSRAGPRVTSLLATARRYMRTAYSSFQKSQFQEAISEYNKAKSIYEKAEDNVGTVFVEYRLAHCYVLQPETRRARAAFSRLLTIAETNQYRWLIAQSLYGLAHASIDEDRYSGAVQYSERALAVFGQIGDTNGVLKCLVQLADFNQAMSLIGKSLNYLGHALTQAQNTNSQLTQKWGILNQLGFSMSSLQLHAAALFYQKEALDLAVKFGNRFLASRSYGYVGSAYATRRMYPEAVTEATQALEIGETTDALEGIEITANASLRLGDIFREAGSCDRAIPNYDRSLRLYRKLKTENYSYEAHKGKLQCLISAASKKAVREELRAVLRLSELYRFRITTQNQRNSFFDTEQSVYDLGILFESGTENNYVKAFEYSERSKARSLLDAVLRGAKLRKKHGEIDVILPVVTRSLSLRQIQRQLPAQAQIVQYAVLDDRLIIWVITRTDLKYQDVPITARELSEKVSAFLETIRQPASRSEEYRKLATDLHGLLIGPIESSLKKSKMLCVVGDKILTYLPFAALTSPAGNYLVQDYDISVAASGSLFVTQSAAAKRYRQTSTEKLLIAGDPKFNRKIFSSLRELPSSALECKELARLYPHHQLLVRDDATESAIRAAMVTADVAHFAMHFVVNEGSEMLSGFPITPEPSPSNSEDSDGFLQSYEIYGLKLRRMRLAILSACQTGIERQYRGEGAVGAARPFFVAGVPTVVASLWPIDSDASADLMVSFHKHRRESDSVTQALKRAQLDMIRGEQIDFRHPYYWAPFLAIGGVVH